MLYEETAPSYDRVPPFGYMFGVKHSGELKLALQMMP